MELSRFWSGKCRLRFGRRSLREKRELSARYGLEVEDGGLRLNYGRAQA
jgi:hypothetical protein